MGSTEKLSVQCGSCGSRLGVPMKYAGREVACPSCKQQVLVPATQTRTPDPNTPQANGQHERPAAPTKKQKDFAASLGIQYSPDVTREQMTQLITEAVQRRDGAREERYEQLLARDGEAWEQAREHFLSEVEANDCLLSKATPAKMMEAIEARETAAILITFPPKQDEDYESIDGVNFSISFTNFYINEEDMRSILTQVGMGMLQQSGKLNELSDGLEQLSEEIRDLRRKRKK